mgnify:CR=1 FL=1
MQYTHDVVATVGTYTDHEGNEKKRYVKCGAVFTREDGSMAIKMDTMPLGQDWSGWFSVYDAKKKEQKARPAKQAAPTTQEPFDEDIPF